MRSTNKQNQPLALIISCLLCTVFIVQVINKSVYTHVHISNDGIVINHAHPYDKSSDNGPIKSHHHSNAEYAFLEQLRILFFLVVASGAFLLLERGFNFTERTFHKYSIELILFRLGRSPPF